VYRAFMITIESMSNNETVKGAGSRGETSSDHIINDIRHAVRVAISRAVHELFHECEPEVFLLCGNDDGERRAIVVFLFWWFLSPGFFRRSC